ncbi:hypothetical protein PV10_02463 [Exophiala mesophila]|uniref:Mediator of RNA polymerase II transcription subunit 17 n=1 Tax=Exophiala mesophila TaxID=212818 RepID=A0A0D1WYZ8_EXOME|nr:uncharacterized protein PV10_02463 [Exophiala mesophila]KIV94725.1 hypothetical protein PV10_02463 [Exophiala mesophila]
MSESRTINLPIPPLPASTSPTLQTQIQQVIAQKGHFHKVTEKSLRAEIDGQAESKLVTDSLQKDDQAKEDESPQARQERIWKSREQMMGQLNYAQNEILCALDFVSLLISKQSTPAQTSMSPALKEAVPIGTLASHLIQPKPPSASARKQLNLVSQGWRCEGFKAASQKLASASAALGADSDRESTYWAQVADLKARGWPVSRLPRDNKAIGVHFGFSEAAPQFRDRGFGLLRQADDGSIYLDTHAKSTRQGRLAVYIVRKGHITGAFLPQPITHGDSASIEAQITEARDSLFDQELFHEITREARLMANQGVVRRAQSVEIAVGSQLQIRLTLDDGQKKTGALDAEDEDIAQFLGMSLRLLLAAAHQQNLARRSQRPPVMVAKPRPTPEYALLRPILAHLRHKAAVDALMSECHKIVHVLTKAGLPAEMSPGQATDTVFESLKTETSSSILPSLLLPAKTALKLSLGDFAQLDVGIATFLGPPLFGTRYETSEIDFGFSSVPKSQHETLESTTVFIRRILLLGLVTRAKQLASENTQPQAAVWSVSSPYNGELTRYESGEAVQKLQIAFLGQSISMRWISDLRSSPKVHQFWSWNATGCSHAGGTDVTFRADQKFDEIISSIFAESA